jgi:hypothetical protein
MTHNRCRGKPVYSGHCIRQPNLFSQISGNTLYLASIKQPHPYGQNSGTILYFTSIKQPPVYNSHTFMAKSNSNTYTVCISFYFCTAVTCLQQPICLIPRVSFIHRYHCTYVCNTTYYVGEHSDAYSVSAHTTGCKVNEKPMVILVCDTQYNSAM